MLRYLYFFLLAFVVALAIVIGWRLSDQAMTVIIGVVAGVAASIPTSLIVVWAATRMRQPVAAMARPAPAAPPEPPLTPEPRVIIVQSSPAMTAGLGAAQAERSLTALPAYTEPEPTALNGVTLEPREFKILGEE